MAWKKLRLSEVPLWSGGPLPGTELREVYRENMGHGFRSKINSPDVNLFDKADSQQEKP